MCRNRVQGIRTQFMIPLHDLDKIEVHCIIYIRIWLNISHYRRHMTMQNLKKKHKSDLKQIKLDSPFNRNFFTFPSSILPEKFKRKMIHDLTIQYGMHIWVQTQHWYPNQQNDKATTNEFNVNHLEEKVVSLTRTLLFLTRPSIGNSAIPIFSALW